MIAIIDYQMGNLRSVEKAFLKVGARAVTTSDKNKISRADKIVLPGVGAFGDGMKELKKHGFVNIIKDAIAEGNPFFGICLGMQLLFEASEEAPGVEGLGIFEGKVKRFRFSSKLQAPNSKLKIPHMGWNRIVWSRELGVGSLIDNVVNGAYVYFVHSYYCDPKDKSIIAATTNYGMDFAAAVSRDNVCGCQFHPEKSQDVGLKILENFVKC